MAEAAASPQPTEKDIEIIQLKKTILELKKDLVAARR